MLGYFVEGNSAIISSDLSSNDVRNVDVDIVSIIVRSDESKLTLPLDDDTRLLLTWLVKVVDEGRRLEHTHSPLQLFQASSCSGTSLKETLQPFPLICPRTTFAAWT